MPPDDAGTTFKNSIDDIFNNHNVSGDNMYDIEHHAGTDTLKVNKETSNESNTNFDNQCYVEENDLNQALFNLSTYLYTIFAGFSVDFLAAYAAFEDPQLLFIIFTLLLPSVYQTRRYRELLAQK